MYELAPEETTATLLIDEHYEKTGMLDWNLQRVWSLCRKLDCTPHELGKLFGVAFKEMTRYIDKGSFPGPLCLHLSMLEGALLQRRMGKPMPVLPLHLLSGRMKRTAA